jgi:preprotein translocase subunit YajC
LSTYSSQPSAPGREGPAAPPVTTTPGTAPAEPASSGSGAGGFLSGPGSILIMVLPILLIFMTMRGQTKKQKQIESGLKTGDTVVTQSGMIGKITELVGDTRVKIEIAPGVNVRMLKSAITGVDGGEVKADGKSDGKSSDAKDKPQEKKA